MAEAFSEGTPIVVDSYGDSWVSPDNGPGFGVEMGREETDKTRIHECCCNTTAIGMFGVGKLERADESASCSRS